jgi:hypothetical protein
LPRPKKGQEHPREEFRDKIKLMTAIGVPQAQIAGILKMSLETLSKQYRDELDYGANTANTVVGGKIFEAAKRGEQWACTLWAARRMGWKETSEQIVRTVNDTSELSEIELQHIARAGRPGVAAKANGASKPDRVH